MEPAAHRFLLSQRAALHDLLERAPEGSIITRSGLQNRLQEIESQLEPYEGVSPHLMRARLVLAGPPVPGSSGTGADLFVEAVSQFARALALVGGSQGQPLSSTGPVSGSDDFRILITGAARGSFGFDIREASDQSAMYGESTAVEMAMARVKQILQASVGNDEQLAEAVDTSDSRALRAIQSFLKIVSDADAVCGLSYDEGEFRFQDSGQVKRSQERLRTEYIKESDAVLAGQFLGLFPVNPRPQFMITGGEVAFPAGEAYQIVVAPMQSDMVAELGVEALHRLALGGVTVRLRARSRTVGSGRPRYVFTGWSDYAESVLDALS